MSTGAETTLAFPPALFAAGFLVIFPLFWCLIVGFIAAMGWRRIAAQYPATSDPPFSADRVHWASLSIGGGMKGPNYGSCINAWLSQTGFWLRPSLPFRPFHPMIHIPWSRVRALEEERLLLAKRLRVTLDGGVPDLLLSGRLAKAVQQAANLPVRR